MYKIGFQNFRRFPQFSPLEYKGITFLVGRNNAGKSTLVKALILIVDYLKSNNLRSFSFSNKNLEDANIVTYDRAKNKFAQENIIKFLYDIDEFSIEVHITGNPTDTSAEVLYVSIRDNIRKLQFLFEPKAENLTISRFGIPDNETEEEDQILSTLKVRASALKKQLEESTLKKTSKEYIDLADQYNSIQARVDLLSEALDNNSAGLYSLSLPYKQDGKSMIELIDDFVTEADAVQTVQYNQIQAGEDAPENYESYRAIKEDASIILKSFQTFNKSITDYRVVYLGANPTKQSALFAIRDKSNALAQTIHEYFQLKVEPGTATRIFVESWMKKFEVGDSYDIKMYAGEAYEVKIKSHGTEIPLADKGMGSIQAMLLILRIACIIERLKSDGQIVTVIIEEPELNLHPELQSLLAEFFHDVFVLFNIRLIVETHSEYLIRNTQLIVKRNEYEVKPNENPFCVIYFNSDLSQWYMKYRPDGVFIDDFGPGFFDVSSKHAIALLKKTPVSNG